MINTNQITSDTPVVCCNNSQFAVVDRVEGASMIKLKQDADGQHHYIPLSWVQWVNDKVHIDRPVDQAIREWSDSPRATSASNLPKKKRIVVSPRASQAVMSADDEFDNIDTKVGLRTRDARNARSSAKR